MSNTTIQDLLSVRVVKAIQELYDQTLSANQISFQKTKREFEGDITLLVFPLTKASKRSPEETASGIGEWLKKHTSEIKYFNVVKGFLNLVIDDIFWITYFNSAIQVEEYGSIKSNDDSETVMVEFSSPNTNKPLHLGHIRNNLLGVSVSEILRAAGKKVVRVNLVNDRGIHICKSMLAWKKWGNGETPQSTNIKGDHLVGKYYVEFSKQLENQKAQVKVEEKNKEEIEKNLPLMQEVQDMLRKWEAGDKETVELWRTMNEWVYEGFEKTYKNLGVEFEKTYHESETYLLGKQIVEDGLQSGVFLKKEDGSVWIDLTKNGLDEKLVLRSDGTSVYITQDMGTAIERQKEFQFNRLVYIVGNEQDYHFKVLFLILKQLGYLWADKLYHLSYGMVDLPSGKMKSREGTVVDADDLMEEMIQTAKKITNDLGKAEEFSVQELEELYRTIGLGALKYFILKVDPKKRMLFDPKESIDFNGNTGPFIQYTYARIRSILRKAEGFSISSVDITYNFPLGTKAKELIKFIHDFPAAIQEAAKEYNPGHIANYVYELAKEYNQFYHDIPILKAESKEKEFRLALSYKVAAIIKSGLKLLGITVPDRM